MKKGLKIALIALLSLLGVVVAGVAVACWLVFTPARLTAIVNKYSDKILTCENHFEKVDLTLFKTFPNAGLKVENVVLINPMDATSDTLARIESVTLAVNIRDYLKEKDIKVEQLLIDNTLANLYIDSLGNGNYDIFVHSTDEDTTTSSEPFTLPNIVDLKKIKFSHFNCRYDDQQNKLLAQVDDMDLTAKGSLESEKVDARMELKSNGIVFQSYDTAGNATLAADLSQMGIDLAAQGTLDALAGKLQLLLPEGDVKIGDVQYATRETAGKHDLLKIELPYQADLSKKEVTLKKSSLKIAQFLLNLDGRVLLPLPADSANQESGRDMEVDLTFASEQWDAEKALEIVPANFKSWQKGMDITGDVRLEGSARGILNDTLFPPIDATVTIEDGTWKDHDLLPYDFKKINASIDALLDISAIPASPSKVNIRNLQAETGKNKISLSGTIDDLLETFLADVRLKGDIRLPDIKPLLPESLDLEPKGKANINLHAKADLDQIAAVDLKNMMVDACIQFKELDVRLDSMTAEAPALKLDVDILPGKMKEIDHQMLTATLTGPSLHADIAPSAIDADLTNVDLTAAISDVMAEEIPFAFACKFNMGRILATIDSMQASVVEPSGKVRMQPNQKDQAKVHYDVDYNSESLFFKLNDSMSLNMAGLTIKGKSDYDSTRGNTLEQWSPDLDIDFKNGYVDMAQLMYMLQIPSIKFNYKPERCEIASANLVFGNSDYYLSGAVTGLEKWLSHKDMLRGDLYFTSNFTNVDDLMATFSGMGTDADTLEAQRKEDNVKKEANPFIVPKDVDFTLHTRIKEALAFDNELQELAGNVTIRDGVAVLDQIGFVCKAARMQLTALYQTPRVNHLFLGMDFHLLDINIDELIEMIPYVDTLVPMLSSFDGNADFHLCAETYLNAYYQPKMSTLRGAADINGTDLVVLDNEKISNIAKVLKMKEWRSKDDKIRLDSLDVAMTVFRKQVEVFPFLLTLDKYQLVAGGRHGLDNSCDYHIELIKSPLPGRLAVDIFSLNPFTLKLSPVRYAEMYKPEKRNDVQEQTLRLKQMIRESLEANVHESTRRYQGLDALNSDIHNNDQ